MWHGIIVDKSLNDEKIPPQIKVINKKVESSWIEFTVEVSNTDLDNYIQLVQKNMYKNKAFYNHFYNGKEIIVVFKNKIFRERNKKNSWNKIIQYGMGLGIPKKQLTFEPNRFEDEIKEISDI